MNRNQKKRARMLRERKANRALMIIFVAVLFIGLFSQVMMVARLTGQSKAIRSTNGEIKELQALNSNLALALKQFGSQERVARRARELGMTKPGREQIRVVHLNGILADTGAQSVENIGAEAMQ